MNYSCLSCAAKYSIPDARLAAAGGDGLRIRCSRCRAIMAVTTAGGRMTTSRNPRSTNAFDAFGPAPEATTPVITGVIKDPFANIPAPSLQGGLSTTSREVTGVFMPLLMAAESDASPARSPSTSEHVGGSPLSEQLSKEHRYFAAIEGRSRGPYTPKELVMLADKGKIRGNTLLWRPGASGWVALRRVTEYDVGYLKDAVYRRKRREQEAAAAAMAKRGIVPIHLERQVHGRRQAPQIPADAWDTALDDSPALSGWPAEASSSALRAPTTSRKAERRFPWRVASLAAVLGLVVAMAAISFGLV